MITNATSRDWRSATRRERATLPEDEQHLREEEIARQREIARAYRASDRLLRESNLLTFGMQLLDAVRALDEDAALAAAVRERYRYILVDEFQDTNVAQIELLWRLAAGHRNIVAVGDNAQAIYRFRGASFGSFTIFLERFAGIPRGNRDAAMPLYPAAGGQLPIGRTHAARLRASGELHRTLAAGAQERAGGAQARRRESAHRGIRLNRGRGPLDRSGNRAAASRGPALAQLRGRSTAFTTIATNWWRRSRSAAFLL